MFLSASPQDVFRASEIVAQDDAATTPDSRETFRTSEIVTQNADAAAAASVSNLTRYIMIGGGLFLVYMLLLKGRT